MQDQEKVKYQLNLKWKSWFAAQVILPFAFACLLWPAGHFLLHLPDAFGDTFAGGDLVLFGAMLLLGMVVDLYCEQKTNSKLGLNDGLDNIWMSSLVVGMLYLLLYAFIKYASMQASQLSTDEQQAQVFKENIKLCSRTSLFAGIFACVWSIAASLMVKSNIHKQITKSV